VSIAEKRRLGCCRSLPCRWCAGGNTFKARHVLLGVPRRAAADCCVCHAGGWSHTCSHAPSDESTAFLDYTWAYRDQLKRPGSVAATHVDGGAYCEAGPGTDTNPHDPCRRDDRADGDAQPTSAPDRDADPDRDTNSICDPDRDPSCDAVFDAGRDTDTDTDMADALA